MTQPCSQEANIGKMLEKLDTLYHDFYGNDREGFRDVTIKLSANVEHLANTVNELRPSVAALVKFQNEVEVERVVRDKLMEKHEQEKDKRMSRHIAVLGTLIAAISAAISYFVSKNV